MEGCEEALSMIVPSQEIILVLAICNKLKSDAHRSILGRVFNSLQGLIEFLRSKYGPREMVYEAQARLAYVRRETKKYQLCESCPRNRKAYNRRPKTAIE